MVCSNDGDMEVVYYGSTCQQLSRRMAKHRYDYKDPNAGCRSKYVFDKYDVSNCHIELLELYSCSSKAELEHAENEYIRNNVCSNKKGKGRSNEAKKKYYIDNREKILERSNLRYKKISLVCKDEL
tara:strand:- start:68 stop:445 length:378 start_codon:yes stop_codon:yes gene_type:complete